jgi:hypothetical protein
MTAYQLFQLPKATPIASGVIVPGARVSFFLTGTSTPTPVYTTSALSTTHTQPVEADAAGVLPPIYLDPTITYKATINTAADVLIYTVDPVNDSLVSADVIGQALYPLSDAEQSAGLDDADIADFTKNYDDFRRYGTNATPGTTDMTTAIANAVSVLNEVGGGELKFQPESYLIWDSAVADLFYFINTRGIRIIGNGARFVTGQTDYAGGVYLIRLSGCDDTYIENMSLHGGNTSLATTGEVFAVLLDGCQQTTFVNCSIYNGSTFIGCGDGNDPGSDRVSGITVLNAYAEETFYGIACSGDGDNLFVRNYKARGCGRSYFPWNVKNHDVWVDSQQGGALSDCLIKAYVDTTWAYRRLENIKLKYISSSRYTGGSNQNADEALVAFDVQQLNSSNKGAAIVDGIDINFQVEADSSPTHRRLFTMRRYDNDGSPDTTSRSHQFFNWRFSGVVRSAQNFVEDVITCFSSIGTWTGDLATNFHFEDLVISGSATQNGLVINATPFSNVISSLKLTNVMTDTDFSITNLSASVRVSYENVKADNFSTYGTATYDPASLADGAGATTTVTVTGAVTGDAAFASFSNDLQGILLTAWVSAADTVSVRFQNETGGTIDLANGTIRAWLRKRAG